MHVYVLQHIAKISFHLGQLVQKLVLELGEKLWEIGEHAPRPSYRCFIASPLNVLYPKHLALTMPTTGSKVKALEQE